METLWVGIDIGKETVVVAAVQGDEMLELGEYSNERAGFAKLADLITDAQTPLTEVHLVVEPTGGYEQALVAFAHEQAWRVSLPNPKLVRDWAKGMGQRAKTAPKGLPQDALLLARYGAARQPMSQPPLAQEVSELDSLLKRRRDLEQMLQQEKNSARGAPEQLAERPGIAGAVLPNLEHIIDMLEEALEEINQAIDAHQQQYEPLQKELKRLLALPGIGAQGAPQLVSSQLVLLHRWQTLTDGEGTAKGLTAYVGLDPQPHESGRSVRKRASISKMGDTEMRRLLYMGALSAVQGKNPLHIFYERLVKNGKPKKVAVVAAARKLLTWAWTLFSRQTQWSPQFHTN